MTSSHPRISKRFHDWFFEELVHPASQRGHVHGKHPWWQVMCLTGVDYFSTLAYQPGIALLAAGVISPFATLVLVLMTLFVAYPTYSIVAKESPHGEGSISLLERLFARWKGKATVLLLLGFAATDFVITITLSAADATEHLIKNPLAPDWLHSQVGITLLLLVMLAVIFLMGFTEAIFTAVVIVATFLVLTLAVLGGALHYLWQHPQLIELWFSHIHAKFPSWWQWIGVSLLLFPKLALGLSGFETGVAVMPLVSGDPDDTEANPAGRIRNTRKLLLASAVVMSVYLIVSSFVTTVLIDTHALRPDGTAYGRAISYVAHELYGETFGSIYDASTILILFFAGASAMAGLLNLIPRYLPRFGMAPEWAVCRRPLVMVILAVTVLVTFIFEADVQAQGGAYATGVLVLMSSAAVGAAVVLWHSRYRLAMIAICIVFAYTTVTNIIERPDGIKIASVFILAITAISLLSRAVRSTELRVDTLSFDDEALRFIAEDDDQVIRVVAHRPGVGTPAEYDRKERAVKYEHSLAAKEHVLFLEVQLRDASEFDAPVHVQGVTVGSHRVLRAVSPVIPNTIAAILLEVQRMTHRLPHAYFGWTEGNPVGYLFRYLFLGEGDVAIITREVLRRHVENPEERPRIHVS
ncbi:MAG: APC family permease [Bryobacterales bacterium]|nr:APC family permease [Bryobacterales bacterium]